MRLVWGNLAVMFTTSPFPLGQGAILVRWWRHTVCPVRYRGASCPSFQRETGKTIHKLVCFDSRMLFLRCFGVGCQGKLIPDFCRKKPMPPALLSSWMEPLCRLSETWKMQLLRGQGWFWASQELFSIVAVVPAEAALQHQCRRAAFPPQKKWKVFRKCGLWKAHFIEQGGQNCVSLWYDF